MILSKWHYILLAISIFSIIIALIAEFFYNLQPCELCLKQRHPYYLFILFSFISLFTLPIYKLYLSFLIQIGTVYGIFYSIWHVGVENKLLKGPAGCSSRLTVSSNTNELKDQIFNNQVVACDDVIWAFFGISAATINSIVLLLIFVINALYIYKHYDKKEKN
tara:strand:+ start:1083 stop:1571 length:489 start_codon:yes stop_codon:yes gene_type:complete